MDKNAKTVLKVLAKMEPVTEPKTVELIYQATTLTLNQVLNSLTDLYNVGFVKRVANGTGRFAYKYVISEFGKEIV